MRATLSSLPRRRMRPAVLGLGLFTILVSSAMANALLATEKPPRQPPTLSPEKAAARCPAGGDRAVAMPGRQAAPPKEEAGNAPGTPAAVESYEAKGSEGCVSCHRGIEPSHKDAHGGLNCVSCHGGDGKATLKEAAHVQPRYPAAWGKNRNPPSSANPPQSYTLLNREKPEFIRFVNPGDLRVVHLTCGHAGCHEAETREVRKSMMTTDGMLYGAAVYNNGTFPIKNTRFGESYSMNGVPQRVEGYLVNDADNQDVRDAQGRRVLPTPDQTLKLGLLPFLDPLPRWEITQVGNVLRVFERGGRRKGEVGNPNREEDPGRPDNKLSFRGHGTLLRTDPVFLGLQKTRLFDPTLNFLGTNDQPGDYHSSGCTACHNVYANDADPAVSDVYWKYGHWGESQTKDQALQDAVQRRERGHPITHRLAREMPTSQCMACHIHPGGNMVTTYLGMIWWDNETDGNLMYPDKGQHLTPQQKDEVQRRNPDGAALKGKWADLNFLAQTAELNPRLKRTQFGDFHSHGWIYRKVYKHDRVGNLLDREGRVVADDNPDRWKPNGAVHLEDIHLEKGMHCVDCHFTGDAHGNGNLYQEPRLAIHLDCIDCHGTVQEYAGLITNPDAAKSHGRAGQQDLANYTLPFKHEGDPSRWAVKEDPDTHQKQLIQYSALDEKRSWKVVQVKDTVTPGNPDYNPKSRWAKLVMTNGKVPAAGAAADPGQLAHADSKMTCYSCHTAWTPSCFGCHLSMSADRKKPQLHNEGAPSRNWTSYNFQTLRDDAFMLGRDGTATGHRICPVRSSCAVVVSSQNQNREWNYQQQQTISAEGLAGTAFSSFVPHTVRGRGETKLCTDCHRSNRNDNNAWLANVFLQGTKFYNFIGRYAFVGTARGFDAVVVTEREEPQAVIGSTLHRLAYPEMYAHHLQRGRMLERAFEHPGRSLTLQRRGEYLYSAEGSNGVVVYDIADIDNKGFSERVVTAPVSPLGQRFYVKTRYATSVTAPTTLALDPARTHRPENQEPAVHPLYAYLYITDRREGLILVNAATLLDGNPLNNFLKRSLTWNPDGILDGASSIKFAGTCAYITCDRGLVVVNLNEPLKPRVAAEIGPEAGGKREGLNHPRSVAIQLRYAFVVDDDGLKVLNIESPEAPRLVPGAFVPLKGANDVYVARTYAYVADGKDGLAIVNVENPEAPKLDQRYDAEGHLNDARMVRLGMTNNSLYAYVADGKNGLRILQLLSPDMTPTIYGFSPHPTPRLIATYKTRGDAIAVAEGQDRDRAVDESGHQLSVFGRRGAGPLTPDDWQRMLKVETGDDPSNIPNVPPALPTPAAPDEKRSLTRADLLLVVPLLGIALARRRRRRRDRAK